ncbi:hypothetical protein [Kiloniella sp.]|uniref:hypothetical protein n=1 Tax=Kiloniella sp. TaxID=1938587 RepID=UPI003B02DB8F
MASTTGKLLKIILPKRKGNEKGTGLTSTHSPGQADRVLTAPDYRDHIKDLFTTRGSNDSREILQELFKFDTDVSAAVNAYLTVANTEPLLKVYDLEGNIDREGHKLLNEILTGLTTRSDYSKGFQLRPSLRAICENMRYMVLLRGGIGSELVLDKTLVPSEIRHIDLKTIQWYEQTPGQYTPVQLPPGSNDEIDLNIPTFFVSFYRRDPTKIYSYSPFVSVINTVAARQQVINDLYRIMQITGFPRMDVTVTEEVLRRNAPANVSQDENELKTWLNSQMQAISSAVTNLQADQAFVHSDSVEVGIVNEGGPKQAMDVRAVIEVLDAQNQAALKIMATVIGKGDKGVNTASVEATLFAKNAEELNNPVAEILSKILTFALRLHGSESRVEVSFDTVILRPEIELENHFVMRQSRYLELLSSGLISDDDFHVKLFNRIRPDNVPELSGTNFYGKSNAIDPSDASTNGDPMGRSLTPEGAKGGRSKEVKK